MNATRSWRRMERVIRGLFADGTWFRFPCVFLRMMEINEAVLLAYLINHSSVVMAHRNKGWFYCHWKRIEEDLNMHQRTQSRTVAALLKTGFIKTKYGGNPSRRFLKIQTLRLILAMERTDKRRVRVDTPV